MSSGNPGRDDTDDTMEIHPHNGELRLLTSITMRLPRIRGAGVIGNKLASFYARRRRHAVVGDVLGVRMILDPHECVDSTLLFMPHLYEHEEVRFLRENIHTAPSLPGARLCDRMEL